MLIRGFGDARNLGAALNVFQTMREGAAVGGPGGGAKSRTLGWEVEEDMFAALVGACTRRYDLTHLCVCVLYIRVFDCILQVRVFFCILRLFVQMCSMCMCVHTDVCPCACVRVFMCACVLFSQLLPVKKILKKRNRALFAGRERNVQGGAGRYDSTAHPRKSSNK